MKKKKKVIALFIAMFMVFSLVPSYAVQTSPQLPDEVTISEDADTEPAPEKEALEETAIDNIQQDDTATENDTALGNDNVDKKQLAEDSKNVEKAVTDSAVKATPKNSGSTRAPERTSLRTVLYSDGTLIINEHRDDRTENEKQHGAIIETYLPYGDPYIGLHEYTFDGYTDVLWYHERFEIQSVEFGSAIEPVSTAYWFYGLYSLRKVDFNNLNTSSVTNMKKMFRNCESLTNLDLSNFNTSNVLDMSYMFYACRHLKTIVLDGTFDTSKVTNMLSMFNECESLTNLDLSNFNTSNVLDMSFMFYGCTHLKTIVLDSTFDTSKVTNMSSMFNGCLSLTELDLSNFNTSNVLDMSYMFYECTALKEIKVDEWNFKDTVNTRKMFANCANLSLTMKMNAVPAQSSDMFNEAATEDTADITLIPTSIQTEDWCNEQVLQYGSAGTVTQGNIHLPYIDVTIDESINFSADTKGNISDTITIKNNGLFKISSKMSMNLSNGWEIVPNTSYITGKDQKKATLALNGTSLASANASNLEIESGASSQLTLNGKVGIFTKTIDEEFGKLVLEIENKYYEYTYPFASMGQGKNISASIGTFVDSNSNITEFKNNPDIITDLTYTYLVTNRNWSDEKIETATYYQPFQIRVESGGFSDEETTLSDAYFLRDLETQNKELILLAYDKSSDEIYEYEIKDVNFATLELGFRFTCDIEENSHYPNDIVFFFCAYD